MTFWLDHPSRRSSWLDVVEADLDEPELSPEPSEPCLIHAAPLRGRARGPSLDKIAGALTAAVVAHAGLALLLGCSMTKARRDVEPPASPAAMFVSLTPLSAVSARPSADPPTPTEAVDTVSEVTQTPSQTATPDASNPPAAETSVAPSLQSATHDDATLNASPIAKADISPVRDDTYNPWAHASVPQAILSPGEKLWAAVKPCLTGRLQGSSSSIRVVLDAQGMVETVIDQEGHEPPVDPDAGVLARAAMACGPYDQVVPAGASYMIAAPG